MISEIIDVPFPRAAVKFLISFLTLKISIYCVKEKEQKKKKKSKWRR